MWWNGKYYSVFYFQQKNLVASRRNICAFVQVARWSRHFFHTIQFFLKEQLTCLSWLSDMVFDRHFLKKWVRWACHNHYNKFSGFLILRDFSDNVGTNDENVFFFLNLLYNEMWQDLKNEGNSYFTSVQCRMLTKLCMGKRSFQSARQKDRF